MRYWYTMGATAADGRVHDVTLQACGSFPGFGADAITCATGLSGNHLYTEVPHGNGTYHGGEVPEFDARPFGAGRYNRVQYPTGMGRRPNVAANPPFLAQPLNR